MTQQLTKFQRIALPLVDRGFAVTPVRPDAKAGAAGAWIHWQYRTREEVLTRYVAKYADCNAGVVGIRGKGNLCFLDNDGGIPSEILAKLPKTYRVRTRPDGQHEHFYFIQTDYSLSRFGVNAKTINIRDTGDIVPSPSGGVMYRTRFDVKGVGGASLVVAAESTKSNGDIYTCVDDSPVAPIPNSLVDWILDEQKTYKRALNRIRRANLKAKQRAAKLSPEYRERLRQQGDSDGFDIFPIDRQQFTRSRAFKYARIGVTGDKLVNLLIDDIERYVEGGIAYCQSERSLASLQGIARHAEEMTAEVRQKEITNFYEDEDTTWLMDDNVISRDDIPVPVRKNVLRDIVREFPDKLTREEADDRLADGMNCHLGLKPYDKRGDRTALSEIRKELGFEVRLSHWIRTTTPISPSPPHNTGEMTDTCHPIIEGGMTFGVSEMKRGGLES